MTYRVAVDIGGTFTDLFIVNNKGEMGIFKSPSIPEDPAKAVFNALELAAKDNDVSVKTLLTECEFFVHGTTRATNAVLERKTAKTGLICTNGFRDILTLGMGGKPEPFNLLMPYTPPYLPRYLTLPVRERINYAGEVIEPLNEDDVRQAIKQFRAWNVEAVGVCLLWSMENPVHEQRIAQIIAEEWPGVSCSISSEVQPIIREYLRTSATALDASLKPLMDKYLANLERLFKEGGLKTEVLVAVSTGGVMPVRELLKRPVYALLSGPASAPLAGLFFSEQVKENNLITIDMGGTSFDVSVVADGRVATTRVAKLRDVATGINSVEVNTLGAGGGSIAQVDAAGLLKVGPESAGADPGPACYKMGGTEATVTDANLVLGYLNPDYFLGGRMKLDRKRSEEVIQEKVAKPLKIGLMEAANSIYTVVNQNMVGGIQYITIRRGVDPRDHLLVAGGGAGPTHAASIAKELQMKRILIPRASGAFCAVGMLSSDITFDNIGSHFTASDEFDFEGVNQLLIELEKKGKEALRLEGIKQENSQLAYFVDARYPGQTNETVLPLRGSRVIEKGLPRMVEDFHELHQKTYGSSEPGQIIECSHWRVVAKGIMPRLAVPEQPRGGKSASKALKGKRQVYFAEKGGLVETPIYDGDKLAHGNIIEGPAIIEEPTTTVVVLPESKVSVTRQGDYFMELH